MARLWYLTGIPVWAALVTFGGCGDNESLPSTATTATGDVTVAATSTSTSGGLDPDAGPDPQANFGRACERAEDCGTELLCLTSSSRTLSKGGPPHGLCTAVCAQDASVCARYSEGARCVGFGDTGYCLEACSYGSVMPGSFDPEKCHGRTEFACKPLWVDTGDACDSVEDCAPGDVCDGTCRRDLPTCMPQCNGEADCDPELYCDARSGECVGSEPQGQGLAERCNVEAIPDPCRGSCGLVERPEGGRCDEPCTLGAYPTCGQTSDAPEAGCATPVNENAGFGDLGYCALLCDCSEQCPDGLACVVAGVDYLQRPGYCKSPEPSDKLLTSCEEPNTSGSGGSSGSATASGGSGGQASSGEGGAAGAPDASGGTFQR